MRNANALEATVATYLPWIINDTVTRSYGSTVRDTNWITVRMTDVESYVYRYTSLYFDKATGVLVDAYFEDVFSSMPSQKFGRSIVITASSLWSVEGSSNGGGGGGGNQTPGLSMEVIIIGAIVIVAVVVIVAGVLLLKRRGKTIKRYSSRAS